MNDKFIKAYAQIKAFEGGYCNIKEDSGGETYAGIARKFWPNWAGWLIIDAQKRHSSFSKNAKTFSEHLSSFDELQKQVQLFYYQEWWQSLQLDDLPFELGAEIFEQAINLGKSGTGRLVQRACNALNFYKNNPLFDELQEDGLIGKKTITALNLIIRYRQAEKVIYCLNVLQANHYITLASVKKDNRKFLDGWLTRTK